MVSPRSAQPAHVRLLLESLVEPRTCEALDADRWDALIRCARSARLLGVVAMRLTRAGVFDRLDEPVRRHLSGALMEARFRRVKALYLIETVAKLLRSLDARPVLLKGGAYIAQGLEMAEGRLLADVDLMVRRSELDAAELQLIHAGWEFQKTDAYDQHYYRAWSHELPPLRCAGQDLELDLHHTILPPTGRLHPDADALLSSALAVEGHPFRVLAPSDQVLHAAVHLVQDSDCVGRLRDLVDFDALMRHFSAHEPGFHESLLERACHHGLGRPLWYAVELSRAWLETPSPSGFRRDLTDLHAPARATRAFVLRGASLVLPPPDPDRGKGVSERIASAFMAFRYVWLRMPPWLLAHHAFSKGLRELKAWRIRRKAAPHG